MQKICSFYISNVHLVTMILPYLKKQILKNNIIETYFEYDLTENIEKILSNLIITERNKKEILKINWHSNKIKKYIDIENKLKKIINKKKEKLILISGNKNYIKETNDILNKLCSFLQSYKSII